MTKDQAIAVRSLDLSGVAVDPQELAEALWIIRSNGRGRKFSLIRYLIDNKQVHLLKIELRLL